MNIIKKTSSWISYATIAVLTSTSVLAVENDTIDSYQQNALFQPSTQQLDRESRGLVYIYDGMTDKTVNKAMDDQSERIESMMFVNTKVTDENGNLMWDPETGEFIEEEDDC